MTRISLRIPISQKLCNLQGKEQSKGLCILILFIKNITTFESLMFVRNELDRLSLPGVSVEISEIRTDEKLTPSQFNTLREVLKHAGVELFEDKKDILVQRIKNVILDVVYHS